VYLAIASIAYAALVIPDALSETTLTRKSYSTLAAIRRNKSVGGFSKFLKEYADEI